MAAPRPPSRTPDEILNGPIAEGDGRGIGNTLGPDVSVETERREIERGVYERRTFTDAAAEGRQAADAQRDRPSPDRGSAAPPAEADDSETEPRAQAKLGGADEKEGL